MLENFNYSLETRDDNIITNLSPWDSITDNLEELSNYFSNSNNRLNIQEPLDFYVKTILEQLYNAKGLIVDNLLKAPVLSLFKIFNLNSDYPLHVSNNGSIVQCDFNPEVFNIDIGAIIYNLRLSNEYLYNYFRSSFFLKLIVQYYDSIILWKLIELLKNNLNLDFHYSCDLSNPDNLLNTISQVVSKIDNGEDSYNVAICSKEIVNIIKTLGIPKLNPFNLKYLIIEEFSLNSKDIDSKEMFILNISKSNPKYILGVKDLINFYPHNNSSVFANFSIDMGILENTNFGHIKFKI